MSSPRPLSARQPIIYSTPSMIPHARLHPSAPMSIVRMFSGPASATLSEPVKVRTMIRPKRTSETRSIGSNTRLEDRSKEFSDMGRWELKLLRGLQFETVAKQPADNNEKDSGRKPARQTRPALQRFKFIQQSIALPRPSRRLIRAPGRADRC